MRNPSTLLLLILQGTVLAHGYKNVALHGKATQSDRVNHVCGAASGAIDGNRQANFYAGSCTHTERMTNPWWRVDLLDTYIITSMSVTNRGDCCAVELNGAEIHIGNSLLSDGAANPIGYQVLIKPGENMAIYGKASQSTVYPGAIANNAIDGNREARFDLGSCSATNNDFNPWWRLDLGKTHKVFSISITNRLEVHTRINGAEIRIGDSLDNNGNNNPRCAVISTISPGFTETFQCNGMDGRFINIVIPGRNEFLTLCEVEVYASRLD
ncbi:PREDICTED: fucolectin-like [Cyprinodon variegatus]|uniref:fucolectin-like n=1 Tax=Cyprinodon variegatus TaxID=28743 RepID=UPI0007429892|nr:PREDICTED: fucolectin-like [Cyprinodon variegatus]